MRLISRLQVCLNRGFGWTKIDKGSVGGSGRDYGEDGLVVYMEGVVKRFRGKTVLRGVSLVIPRGQVFVIAGPNGAGKTTTIRVMMGLYKPDSGRVRVLGVEPGGPGWERAKTRIGYLPEDASPYERLTGYENILFHARLYAGGDERLVERFVERAIAISGLDERDLARRAGEYSKGMKRRLLLALTLMHRPVLAVLDEPTSGLDVFSAYEVRRMIRELAGGGASIVLTTHNLLEAEAIADMVAFIQEGRVVYQGSVGEAKEAYGASSLEEAFIRAAGVR